MEGHICVGCDMGFLGRHVTPQGKKKKTLGDAVLWLSLGIPSQAELQYLALLTSAFLLLALHHYFLSGFQRNTSLGSSLQSIMVCSCFLKTTYGPFLW